MQLAHFLLTRFNMPTEGKESRIRADDGWLSQRFDLFDTFCLPSVLGQTERDFDWLIYFDSRTPSPFREQIDAYARLPRVHCIRRDHVVPRSQIIDDLAQRCPPGTTHVLTTALDNDDGLARDHVQRVRAGAMEHSRAVLFFPVGDIYHAGRVYRRRDRHNAFPSMIEPIDDFQTVWAAWHTHLHTTATQVLLAPTPAWLQVVHGTNVSNRVRGVRVPAKEALERYEVLPRALRPESQLGIWLENATLTPLRAARELAFRMIKPLLRRYRG